MKCSNCGTQIDTCDQNNELFVEGDIIICLELTKTSYIYHFFTSTEIKTDKKYMHLCDRDCLEDAREELENAKAPNTNEYKISSRKSATVIGDDEKTDKTADGDD